MHVCVYTCVYTCVCIYTYIVLSLGCHPNPEVSQDLNSVTSCAFSRELKRIPDLQRVSRTKARVSRTKAKLAEGHHVQNPPRARGWSSRMPDAYTSSTTTHSQGLCSSPGWGWGSGCHWSVSSPAPPPRRQLGFLSENT